MAKLAVIILAAGLGTRMKSSRPKVMHDVGGEPMLFASLRLADSLRASSSICVLGTGIDEIRHTLDQTSLALRQKVLIAHQKQTLGTGHAVLSAEKFLKGFQGDVLILCGDVPLLQKETLQEFLKFHRKGNHTFSVLSAFVDDPASYGRLIRDANENLLAIVEERHLKGEQKIINEINSGIYLIKSQHLGAGLKLIKKNPQKGEYYLTDLVHIMQANGQLVGAIAVEDPDEVCGVNTQLDLAYVNFVMRERINRRWMERGVCFVDPSSAYVDRSVRISQGVTIGPSCILKGHSEIKKGAILEAGSYLVDTRVDEGAHIFPYSVLESSRVEKGARVGPFAHLRPGSRVGPDAYVGNFVELKKTHLGRGVKAGHLSYLGDTVIGEDANVGAGTITCNYDGFNKHRTRIGARSFIGSDSQLVAPVKLGAGSWVGAGSTITKDVPAKALAVSRSVQVNVQDWVKKRKR
jgi:bifunctional UDP-N-acetylglucosamine pyrophosphorylase / glucosamine-1-phosphate N-acetyltransferase